MKTTKSKTEPTHAQPPAAVRKLAGELFTVGSAANNAQRAKDGLPPYRHTWETMHNDSRPGWHAIAEYIRPRLIAWHYVDDNEMPVEETRVLLARDTKESDEPIFGYRALGVWFDDDGNRLTPDNVYAWAHVPALPAKKGGAS